MRKTILIFIAATLAAAVSTPAAASFWDRCGLKRLECRDHCHRHQSHVGAGPATDRMEAGPAWRAATQSITNARSGRA
jgi:hypothetical protein